MSLIAVSDILIYFVVRPKQTEEKSRISDCKHDSLIRAACLRYRHRRISFAYQAANYAASLIEREATANGTRATSLDFYGYRIIVHCGIYHPFTGSQLPQNPSGVKTVKSPRPNLLPTVVIAPLHQSHTSGSTSGAFDR